MTKPLSLYHSAATLLFTFAMFGLVAGAGCTGNQQIPDPGPQPSGANFQGVWYSPQFEKMFLRQSGETVKGVYTYESGGTLEGKVDGNLLIFEWVDAGSKQTATRTIKGRGYLQLVEENDQLKLKGEWGYDEDPSGAGPWNAEYVEELGSDDPTTLEDLEDNDEFGP